MGPPIRILHILGRMGRGGAEMWLMNVLRRIDRERYRFEFAVHRARAGEFDEEIRALGCPIHLVPSYRHPPRYALELSALLRRGRYDVAHSHVSHFSGYALAIARAAGVGGRIAHSHTAVPPAGDALLRRAYKRVMSASVRANATACVGCSSEACAALFGEDWQRLAKVQRLPYGYDFARFDLADRRAAVRAAVRAELGLSPGDLVIGHIGRFVKPKNHEFIVDIAAASQAAGRARHQFVLVGDGASRPRIERAIGDRGLAGKVRMTGMRSDIPRLLASFDVLILPSLWEGLPVTLIEAQAAGVPCISSDRVSSEVAVLPGAVARLPLGEARAWVEAIDDMAARPHLSPKQALSAMQASEFAIDRHLERLCAIYERQASRAPDR